jgi:hypothetical protein
LFCAKCWKLSKNVENFCAIFLKGVLCCAFCTKSFENIGNFCAIWRKLECCNLNKKPWKMLKKCAVCQW